MKKIFFLLLLGFSTIFVNAQERRSGEDFGGVAFKIAPPVGSFSNDFSLGWGVSAMNEYVLTNRWSASFDITYLRWGAKSENNLVRTLTMIAFTVAPKFYIDNVYLSIEAGGFYETFEAARGQRFTESYQFGVVPVIGFHKGVWDVAIEYAVLESRQWVNLRVGFYLFDFQLN